MHKIGLNYQLRHRHAIFRKKKIVNSKPNRLSKHIKYLRYVRLLLSMMLSLLDNFSISIAVFTAIFGFLIVRLSVCLPVFSTQRPTSRARHGKKVGDDQRSTVKTMIIWGSGGHTTEMILLLQKLSPQKLSPVHCVLAQTDQTSYDKIETAKVCIKTILSPP
jgi:hypothetical protein